MRQFFRKISFFIIVLLAVWIGLELFYRLVPNDYTVKNENMKQAYPDTEILVFGNSHTYYGIDPQCFDKSTFNASNISQTLYFDKLLFDKHFEKFRKLKYVVVPVEYTSLSQKGDINGIQWRTYFYEAQMGLHTGLIKPWDIKRYSLSLVPNFAITIRSLKKYKEKGTLAECRPDGYAPQYGVSPQYLNAEAGLLVMKKHEDGSVDFQSNLTLLRELIATCAEKRVSVILLNMPVSEYYAGNVNQAKRSKIVDECKRLAEIEGVHYLDFFQDERFTRDDFHDVDHLNVRGAEKCSKILNDFIESFD